MGRVYWGIAALISVGVYGVLVGAGMAYLQGVFVPEEVYYGVWGALVGEFLLQWWVPADQRMGYVQRGMAVLAAGFLVNAYGGWGVSGASIGWLGGIAVTRLGHMGVLLAPLRSKPTQLFVAGFGVIIVGGALLLMLPIAHHQEISFMDAVFTAASAVCVTGLTVVEVSQAFSWVGQVIILGLIQIGGLGIMTFYALVTMVIHHRVFSYESQAFQRGWSTESAKETFGVLRTIFSVTLGVECLGAAVIYTGLPDTVEGTITRIFYAIFHSVSAFCNAGFSLFPNSLGVFSGQPVVLIAISCLIIVGGIGFPAMMDGYHRFIVRDRRRLKLQTRLAVTISWVAIVGGWAALYGLAIMDGIPSGMGAWFHAISARTAGFSMMDMGSYSGAALWLIMVLMVVGASPGSTGGGIKTTTLGVLLVALMATVRGHDCIHVFDRDIAHRTVLKALSIFLMACGIISLGFWVLLVTETAPAFSLLFETISAFATVGFSLGVTPELSSTGKVVVILLMFLGRVGPLTLAVSLTKRPKPAKYTLPTESLLLG
jgi:trk system potassium uptake protein TrkH